MTIHNGTHLSIQQISDDQVIKINYGIYTTEWVHYSPTQNGKIVDSITLVKEKHGPNAYKNNWKKLLHLTKL